MTLDARFQTTHTIVSNISIPFPPLYTALLVPQSGHCWHCSPSFARLRSLGLGGLSLSPLACFVWHTAPPLSRPCLGSLPPCERTTSSRVRIGEVVLVRLGVGPAAGGNNWWRLLSGRHGSHPSVGLVVGVVWVERWHLGPITWSTCRGGTFGSLAAGFECALGLLLPQPPLAQPCCRRFAVTGCWHLLARFGRLIVPSYA